MKINDKSFREFLQSLKITEKYIILHVKLIEYPSLIYNINNFWRNLKMGIGKNKTFIVPTFNLNFIKKKKWNKKQTPSKSGYFSEFFRKEISQKRTNNPIHSVCIYGKRLKQIPEHTSASSFGKGSIWEWISNSKDVCNLSIGVGVHGGATFFHYCEEFLNVNYRFKKKFSGTIILDNKKKKKRFSYFARKINKKKKIENDWTACEKDLIKNRILIKKKFDNILFFKMNTYKASHLIIDKLKKKPNYLLKK